jgi:alkylated DNA nucleotide flippase Atl1
MNQLSLTRMVDRMIMDCLVCHQAGMTDPRQVNLMLTDLRLKSTAWARIMTRRPQPAGKKRSDQAQRHSRMVDEVAEQHQPTICRNRSSWPNVSGNEALE